MLLTLTLTLTPTPALPLTKALALPLGKLYSYRFHSGGVMDPTQRLYRHCPVEHPKGGASRGAFPPRV